ncbi:sodium/calcium exchanger protein [Halomarina ordinaria]|uniref:Sodium/calcium exchanger protein n=1 Tax=Halomarina ordinaria TaxID=3033939 RepID=A0ABD5U7R9_9EURY|nr:sodium:calcium antiporter [Halomarina sp. PSRA2]
MSNRFRHPLSAVALTVALTLPWVYTLATHGGHVEPGAPYSAFGTVAVAGLAVLGASFLLAWGAETAEKDVPRAFAIAVLAVLAVAPEYAVDALYAWEAGAMEGTQRGTDAANLAVANMTGANRILIGLGWSAIALFTVYRTKQSHDPAVRKREGFLRDTVSLDRDISTEITFLLAATAFAFFVPLSVESVAGGGPAGGIGLFDTAVLVGLYLLYIGIIIRGDVEEHEGQVGVPGYLQRLPRAGRVAVVLALFAYSGAMIYTAVHPFATGLETIGVENGIPEFFMIQWVAPLASESPELIVVAYLVNKARATAGFNALISSKLNQWTLLIGTLAVVYSIAAGHLGALPFDQKQVAEIWITAAQSLFALSILANFEISVREAVALLVLFVSQVAIEFVIIRTYTGATAETLSIDVLYAYTALYLVVGLWLFYRRRADLRTLLADTAITAQDAISPRGPHPEQAD